MNLNPFVAKAARAADARLRLIATLRTWLTVILIVAIVGYFVVPASIQLSAARRMRVDAKPSKLPASFTDLNGRQISAVAADSATLLVFLDARCVACRLDARSFVDLARWSRDQKMAARLILPNDPLAAAQYGRLAGDVQAVMMTEPDRYVQLGIRATPMFVLVDASGVVRAKWTHEVPTHLAILNALSRLVLANR